MVTRTLSYYDGTVEPPLTIPGASRADKQEIDFTHCLTLPATEQIFEEPHVEGIGLVRGSRTRTKAYFYDSKGRMALMTETDSDGWKSIYSWKYDFQGNVLRQTEEHYKDNAFDSIVTTYTYDNRGRRLTMQRNLNGTDYAAVTYSYDNLGRLDGKEVAGRGSESYAYTLQGWQKQTTASFYGQGVFTQTMNYQLPQMTLTKPRFDGMVSEISYCHLGQVSHTLGYSYDGLKRLRDTRRHPMGNQATLDIWTERNLTYDRNGNITSIARLIPETGGTYTLTYSGNRVQSLTKGEATSSYTYHSNGNIKTDSGRDLQFQYNLLNLPATVTDASGQTLKARYSYLADGTKLTVRDSQNDGLTYRGSFVYTADGTPGSTAVTENLESIAHDEGRFIALSPSSGTTTTQFIDTWHVRDYLGSVRTILDITQDETAVTDASAVILEQNDYLPFGTRVNLSAQAYDPSNRYRYNGKEEQVTGSVGLTDYGARLYDSLLPRWTTQDPLAEKYYSYSPYVFCNNNPVNFVDPDGMDWIKCAETGNYEWRDDIYNDSEIPEGYTYVGSSTDDILKDLNINSQYNMNELSIISIGGDCDEVNPNKSSWRLLAPINIEVTASVKVSPIISFIPANSTGNNLLGKSFTGIKFTAVMTQRQANSINDFDNEAIARFYINYGPKVFDQQLESPKEAYVVPSGTKITSGTIFISASALSPNRSFGNATLGVSAQNFGLYSQTKSIQWKISRYY